ERGAVTGGDDDEIGGARIQAFPSRLHFEEHAHPSSLVLQLVGDDALEADDERCPATTRPQEPVEIHSHDEIDAARWPQEDTQVVEPAVKGMKLCAPAERPQPDLVPE